MRRRAAPGLATQLARAGPCTEAPRYACPPLELASAQHYRSSTQAAHAMQAPAGRQLGYRRHGNPSVLQLEDTFSALQGTAASIAVTSGMAAILLVTSALLGRSDHIIVPGTVFYETTAQLERLADAGRWSLTRTSGGLAGIIAAFTAQTRMVLVESPANPTLETMDLPALAATCRARGVLLVVDNTLLTPMAQNVLDLGADISVYSLSKHLSGHGDVIGGMVCTRNAALADTLRDWRNPAGLALDPFAAWLALRGLRTLPLRLRAHATNGHALARMLQRHVPGLRWTGAWTGPHARSNAVSATLHTGVMALHFDEAAQAADFIDGLHGVPVLPSFGNPETGVFHYGGVVDDPRALAAAGITPGLVRVSPGIEDARDLVTAFRRALRGCGTR